MWEFQVAQSKGIDAGLGGVAPFVDPFSKAKNHFIMLLLLLQGMPVTNQDREELKDLEVNVRLEWKELCCHFCCSNKKRREKREERTEEKR